MSNECDILFHTGVKSLRIRVLWAVILQYDNKEEHSSEGSLLDKIFEYVEQHQQ